MAKDELQNAAGPAPPMMVKFDDAGNVIVDWEMVDRFSQAWDLGIRDHVGVLWARILAAVRAQTTRADTAMIKTLVDGARGTPRVTGGPMPKISDNTSWKPIGWEQLSRAVDELKDPDVIGMAVVLMRRGDAGTLESLPMWSAATGPDFIHSALVMAAEDIASGFRSERGIPGQPVPPLN